MKKAVKITVIVVLILLVLLFGVQWWLGHEIKDTIEQKVVSQTEGRLKAEVGGVTVRLIGRTVHLKDVHITTDTVRKIDGKEGLIYADARIREIVLKGIHFEKKDTVTHIRAGKLKLDLPRAIIISRQLPDSATYSGKKSAGAQPLRLEIGKIDIRLGNVRYDQCQVEDTISYKVRDFFCRIEDWEMNTHPDSLRPLCLCKDMQLSLASFRNSFAEKSQLLEVDSLRIKGREGLLSVGSVRLLPQYAKAEFAVKAPDHADWTRIETQNIVCYGLDMQRMMREQFLQVDSIAILGANISSYKNRQIDQPARVKRLFYESVQQFPYPLAVRRIRLQNVQVEYQELSENGDSPGTVTFGQLEGIFYNLTNVVTSGQPYFVLKAQGMLMGQGALQATFRLPVDSLNPYFEVEGRLGKMSALTLNSMVEPLTKIRITSGEIDGMTFKIMGNAMEAKVNMLFLYQDLKVRLLKEKNGEWKTRSFLTNVVNGLLLDANNPGHRGERKAEASAKRDIYRSQFNYLWRTLFAGLKVTVGLG